MAVHMQYMLRYAYLIASSKYSRAAPTNLTSQMKEGKARARMPVPEQGSNIVISVNST